MMAGQNSARASYQRRGKRNHLAGQAAEAQIARHYEYLGYRIRDQRWRGKAGELDLVVEGPADIIFVEVKSSKTHAGAIEMVTPSKLGRVRRAAAEYLCGLPAGELTPSRVDIACVDSLGAIDVTENVICH